ncbi:hypothetical protein ZWY2020_014722 [Hordeum vulgare]|nr:hypothetical protein ZWY2020_014722 [Hordeum vulgare]
MHDTATKIGSNKSLGATENLAPTVKQRRERGEKGLRRDGSRGSSPGRAGAVRRGIAGFPAARRRLLPIRGGFGAEWGRRGDGGVRWGGGNGELAREGKEEREARKV